MPPLRSFLLVLLVASLPAPGRAAVDSLFYQARPSMGTTFEVYLYAADQATAEALFEEAFAEIDRIEATFSTYQPDSELSRINARAATAPVTTDPEVWRLLQRSLTYSEASDGAFDLSVGRLMKAWGFFRGEGRYPSPEELAATPTGWQQVVLDPANRTIFFDTSGLELDVGGIGKGYALDRVAALLRSAGVTQALIGLGRSSYYAIGTPPDADGWAVRIPDPFDGSRTLSTVSLRDASLSTSGSYEKFFELDGTRYCHIIDPRTREPVQGRVQVTVVAPEAEASDALSTALFVLGPEASAAVLANRPGVHALFVEGGAAETQVVPLRWLAALPAPPTLTP